MVSWTDVCGYDSFQSWGSGHMELCFQQVAVVIPTHVCLLLTSLVYSVKISGRRQQSQIIPEWVVLRLVSAVCALLFAVGAVSSYWLETAHPPVVWATMAMQCIAWTIHSIALYHLYHSAYLFLPGRPLPLCLSWMLTVVASGFMLHSAIASSRSHTFLWTAAYGTLWLACAYAFAALQCVYIIFLVLAIFLSRARSQLPAGFSVQTGQPNERSPLLGQSEIHLLSDVDVSHEDLAGPISKLLFTWLNVLMERGWNGQLQQASHLEPLPDNLKTAGVRSQFGKFICVSLDNAFQVPKAGDVNDESSSSENRTVTLLQALNRCFGWQYYPLGLLRFLSDILGFAGPLLLHALVSFMENRTEPITHGYYYALGLFLSTLLGALLQTQFSYRVNKVMVAVRAALITAIYRKSLTVSSSSLQIFSTGEVVNFMSTDTDRIVNFANSFHYFWSLPFQIAVSLYLLHQQVGLAFLAGLGFCLLMIPVNRLLANKIGDLSQKMMEQKDGRVKLMSELLRGIRVIKFCAWEGNFKEKINLLRQAELQSLKGRKYLDAFCVYLWAATPVIISLLTFGTYVMLGHKLTAAKVFTSVALFNMLVTPLNAFPWVLNGVMESWVSLKRVQSFLLLPQLSWKQFYSPTTSDAHQCDDNVLQIVDGHFSWHPSGSDVSLLVGEDQATGLQELKALNIAVQSGQLVGVVGRVGSGKSSLLAAITAEMQRIGGQVWVRGLSDGFGLAAQESWIQHATIRENITFGQRFHSARYQAVVQACALEEDLSVLPAGDQTEVGENGVTLSGGQKARLALARAVYQDKDVYLLDDPLAAVDAHVAEHLYRECIQGMLRMKTRILCTHHTQFLTEADLVIVMENGEVKAIGPPQQVLSQESGQRQRSAARNENKIELGEESNEEEEETAPDADQGVLVEEEERKQGVVALDVYRAYWLAVGVCLAPLILLSLFLMQASRNVSDWWLAYWISHTKKSVPHSPASNGSALYSSHPLMLLSTFGLVPDPTIVGDPDVAASGTNSSNSTLSFYFTVYGCLGAANTFFTLIRAFLFAYGGVCAARVLHKRLLQTILHAPISFFDVTPIGRIINRFSSDVYAVDDSLPFQLNILLAQFYGLLGTLAITCYGLPWFALLLLPLAMIYYRIQRFYRKTSRELKRLSTVTLSPIYAHFSESLSGLASIRAMRAAEWFCDENEARLELNQRANYTGYAAGVWLSVRLQLMGVAMVAGVAFIAVLEHHYSSVDPGLVGLAVSYALSVTGLLGGVVQMFTETEKEMVSVERVMQYINDVPQECDDHLTQVSSSWPEDGVISMQHVQLTYREGLPLALKGVCFTTKPGEKVGIAGRTGSGKSSLFLVLFKMVTIHQGSVTIDGQDISSLNLDRLRSSMAIIPQDPFLFSGSVRQNLDPCDLHSEQDLLHVISECHLTSVVDQVGGLDGDVGERGRYFSAGQRQLLCLARALLTQTKILCIDEATASVDQQTDRLLQRTIRKHFVNSTVLTIAHRVETILDSDRVLVMNNGKVAEFAPPSELLAQTSSMFYSLVHGKQEL